MLMGKVDCLGNVRDDARRTEMIARTASHKLFQIAAVDQIHHEKVSTRRRAPDSVYLDDVGVPQTCRGLCFGQKPFDKPWLRRFNIEQLDGDWFIQAALSRAVNLTHSTLTEAFLQVVVGQRQRRSWISSRRNGTFRERVGDRRPLLTKPSDYCRQDRIWRFKAGRSQFRKFAGLGRIGQFIQGSLTFLASVDVAGDFTVPRGVQFARQKPGQLRRWGALCHDCSSQQKVSRKKRPHSKPITAASATSCT
jgi:hypothetical protein